MGYRKLLITLILLPALAFGAEEPSQDFLDILALAEEGDAVAQSELGYMYASGNGVPENDVEAVRWYRLAAEQGLPEGQYRLGAKYGNGSGVPQNYLKAYIWSSLANAQGVDEARGNRDLAASMLPPEQLAIGQEAATRCFESNFQDCDKTSFCL